MNKLLKTVLALCIATGVAVPAMAAPADTIGDETQSQVSVSAASFSDINTEDFMWAKPYIVSMAAKELISGYEDGTYRPDNDVTRLEAIALFARAMGSRDKANADVLAIAHEKYDAIIRNYSLSWGQDEVAYMMYKGALKKTDLDTYLKDQEKNNPMARYEAAIIITKAMGGEDEALSDLGVVLNYLDAREVSSNAIQYVSYATDKGIMSGMGDGTFSPNTSVKRSQIAVMLSKTVDKTGYIFEKTTLKDIDPIAETITISSGASERNYPYTEATKFREMGDAVRAANMPLGVDAVVTFANGKAVSVEAVSNIPDETIHGKYISYATTSGRTTVRITVDETGETTSYTCSPNVSVKYDGSPATIRSFTKGDVVTLNLHNGEVESMVGDNRVTTISGAVVEDIDITDGVRIKISHSDEEYDGRIYDVSSDVIAKKNDITVGLDNIYKGDKVKIELSYNEITKIQATSSTSIVEGSIQKLIIESPQSSMVVRTKDKDKEYVIPARVDIIINNEEGSLYDFRVGDNVKITTNGETITKIQATSTQETSGSVTGVVTAVNTSYGVIGIQQDGVSIPTQVMCKDDSTTFISADGKTKKMKDIAIGQTVEVKGMLSNGVFVGKLVVIVSDK